MANRFKPFIIKLVILSVLIVQPVWISIVRADMRRISPVAGELLTYTREAGAGHKAYVLPNGAMGGRWNILHGVHPERWI